MHGLRPCLDNEKTSSPAVFCPFNIHGRADAGFLRVMLFNGHAQRGELGNFFVRQHERRALFGGGRHFARAGNAPFSPRVYHLCLFPAEMLADDGRQDRPGRLF